MSAATVPAAAAGRPPSPHSPTLLLLMYASLLCPFPSPNAAAHMRSCSAAAAAAAQDAALFELRLKHDQAEAAVRRLRERLLDLFGSQAEGGVGAGARKTGGSAPPQHAELMATISHLKTALEKATASSTPTTKYMQVGGIVCWLTHCTCSAHLNPKPSNPEPYDPPTLNPAALQP